MTNGPPANLNFRVDANDLFVKLRRLLKGTLFVGISGIYISLAAVLFLNHGWRTLLLAIFLLALGQLLRYVLNDVDHIGWLLKTGSPPFVLRFASCEPQGASRGLFSSTRG